jgi:hypothetical protein
VGIKGTFIDFVTTFEKMDMFPSSGKRFGST